MREEWRGEGGEETSNGGDKKEEEAGVMREGRRSTKRFVKGRNKEG